MINAHQQHISTIVNDCSFDLDLCGISGMNEYWGLRLVPWLYHGIHAWEALLKTPKLTKQVVPLCLKQHLENLE